MPYADVLFVFDSNASDPIGEAATKIFEKRALDIFHKGKDIGEAPAVIFEKSEHEAISAELQAAWSANKNSGNR